MITRTEAIKAALELFLEVVEEPPEANCSCHVSPPCGDCVEYSGLREAFADANAALAMPADEAVRVPEGWQPVPVDLDEHDYITDAACDASDLFRVDFVRAWEAALAAVPTCTCPSGDGSLRHPCPVHPPRQHPAGHSDCIVELLGQSCPECAREGQCGECHAPQPAVPATGG